MKIYIENIKRLSGHADQCGRIDRMSKLQTKPDKIFIVHIEEDGTNGLQKKVKKIYKCDSQIPSLNEIVNI